MQERVAEVVALGKQLRHEFDRVCDEEATAAAGDRRSALTNEIAGLEATLAAKDALLERMAHRVEEWEQTFGQLAREHEETERNCT